ncbi:MAG: tetratricopeptide repeat protein [Acidobacteria bacterium]|nr:tetratricopeptide repeat protein [Acidobacteriota bacterium]
MDSMFSPASWLLTVLVVLAGLISSPATYAQLAAFNQIQVAPPMRQVEPPSPTASAAELEKQADELRSHKAYLDAIDYFHAALDKQPGNAAVLNKIGISFLMLQRFNAAGKNFEQAIKKDHKFAEAYNNLGVVDYERRKYHGAIKQYKKAIDLSPASASFYSNLGAAYFATKNFEQASQAYAEAVRLDPNIFERTSHTGIAAQMASPADRAHYDYVVAKLYAKMGDSDHSLEYLRKAMEEGYKGVNEALTAPEFAELRKDSRFAELMSTRPAPIPE